MTLVGSRMEFLTFAEAWPSICGIASGAPVCMMTCEGHVEGASGFRPIRQALVRLPGHVVCAFLSEQPVENGSYITSIMPHRHDALAASGHDGSLHLETAPTPAVYVDLCRSRT